MGCAGVKAEDGEKPFSPNPAERTASGGQVAGGELGATGVVPDGKPAAAAPAWDEKPGAKPAPAAAGASPNPAAGASDAREVKESKEAALGASASSLGNRQGSLGNRQVSQMSTQSGASVAAKMSMWAQQADGFEFVAFRTNKDGPPSHNIGNGQQVTWLQSVGEWSKCEWMGIVGFVKSRNLVAKDPAKEKEGEAQEMKLNQLVSPCRLGKYAGGKQDLHRVYFYLADCVSDLRACALCCRTWRGALGKHAGEIGRMISNSWIPHSGCWIAYPCEKGQETATPGVHPLLAICHDAESAPTGQGAGFVAMMPKGRELQPSFAQTSLAPREGKVPERLIVQSAAGRLIVPLTPELRPWPTPGGWAPPVSCRGCVWEAELDGGKVGARIVELRRPRDAASAAAAVDLARFALQLHWDPTKGVHVKAGEAPPQGGSRGPPPPQAPP